MAAIQTVVKRRQELGRYTNFNKHMAEKIGDTLWYLASLASRLKLSLQDIAIENIAKAKDLHSKGTINYFDKSLPKDERLPRNFDVIFEETPLGRGARVKTIVNGIFVGDALTDNVQKDDGYPTRETFRPLRQDRSRFPTRMNMATCFSQSGESEVAT